MADGLSTSDILRPISVDTLYNPPAVEQSYSEGTGFWSTAQKFVSGIVDNLPQIAQAVVQYFPPSTMSATRSVPYPTTVPVTRTVAPLSIPPTSRGVTSFPPTVSDFPAEGSGAAGMGNQTLLLLGGAAVLSLFLLRR